MAATGSTKVIIAALGANALIAVSKFAAAAWTGSAAMLAEAIHSLADTANQGLLLHGIRRARLPADERHPFGHSKELYFWAFVVAILLFSLGAGVAIYEGIEKLRHPHPVTDPWINYAILGFGLLFEAGSTVVALKEFNRQRGTLGPFEALRASKDPGLFTVLLENAAAIAGLLVALVGLAGAHIFEWTYGDAIASIIIGIILGLVAAFMSIETKALLIGEAASPDVVAGIHNMIEREMHPRGPVRRIQHLKTMHLGPDDVLATASLEFEEATSARALQAAVGRMETAITARYPFVRHLYLEAQPADRAALDAAPANRENSGHSQPQQARQSQSPALVAVSSSDVSAPTLQRFPAHPVGLPGALEEAGATSTATSTATAGQRHATTPTATISVADAASPLTGNARNASSPIADLGKRNYPPPKKGKNKKRRR